MRSVLKKSQSYKPELEVSKKHTKDKLFPRPMKLVIPSLAQIQSGLPMMSPQFTGSPSTFLNFPSATSASPGRQFLTGDKINRKRTSSTSTPAGTPNSDGVSTPSKLKLKLKIKRKRNEKSDIYEIDQPKTEFDIVPETSNQPSSADSMSFLTEFDSETTLRQPIFPVSSTFVDLHMAAETDLNGLLGIPAEPFIENDAGFSDSLQVQAFDLDALTSGGDMNLEAVSTNVLDQTTILTSQTSFESEGMIDIDSLMNAVS